jgi:uncharacterized protein
MFELPLFPLNTVLFPGMPLSLHIFEERYKQMINLCVEKREPFGVVLIEQGREVGLAAKPHLVGTTAHITRVQQLSQGRMNIVAVGHERFRILSLSYDRAYLVGQVELYPLEPSRPIGNQRARLRPLVERYLQILKDAGQIQFDPTQLPNDSLTFAYLSAVLLQVPMTQKQKLLAAPSTDTMMAELRQMYLRELALLSAMQVLAGEEAASLGPFSLN